MTARLAALLVLLPAFASANCGLSFCPVGGHGSMSSVWSLSADVEQTGFVLGGLSGHYAQLIPRIEHRGFKNWVLGGALPVVSLTEAGGETQNGLANALLFAEKSLPGGNWKPALGLQLEVPIGDHDHGIAADHWMLVPYASMVRSFGETFVLARAGYRRAFGGQDEDPLHPLLVNPHADQELLYRLGVGSHWAEKSLMAQAYLDGQRVLSADSEFKDFVAAGAQGALRLDSDLDLTANAELPLSAPSRFDWRVGVGLTFRR